MILLNSASGKGFARGGTFSAWLGSDCQSWLICHYMESCHPLPHGPAPCCCMFARVRMCSCLSSFFLATAAGELWMLFWKSPEPQILLAQPTRRCHLLQVEAIWLRYVPLVTEEKLSFSPRTLMRGYIHCCGCLWGLPVTAKSTREPYRLCFLLKRILNVADSLCASLQCARAGSWRRMEYLLKHCHFNRKRGEFPCF